MEVVPYKAEHLMAMTLQPAQAWMVPLVNYEMAKALEGNAMTGLDGDDVLIVAGVAEYWQGRGLLWSYVGQNAHRHWKSIHYAAKRYLELVDYERLEAVVDVNHAAGKRWIERLGFKCEVPLARKYQRGQDCMIYVRIKD